MSRAFAFPSRQQAHRGSPVSGGGGGGGLALGNVRIAIWGQSNALGRADGTDISASPLSSDPGLATFWAGTFSRVYIFDGTTYSQLSSANNQATSGQFGPEFALAVRWMRETTSGLLFIDKWASSGISISNNYFIHGQWPYTTAQSWRAAGNTYLSSHGITINQEAFAWVQGEADYTQTQAWYDGYLTPFLSYLISDGFHGSSDKVVLVQMAVGSAQYGAGVAASKSAAAAASGGNVTTLTTDLDMKTDNLHWNGRGQVQLGYNLFERIFGAAHIAV
jgi:hypothetical protein